MIPNQLDNVDMNILNPINTWSDQSNYDKEAKNLANLFRKNFESYGSEVEYLLNFGPII